MQKPSIFISYRRADSISATGRLHEYITHAFGVENVFKDVEDIPPGMDFREVLRDSIDNCDIVLVVIGTRYLSVTDDQGNSRLHNPNDWVRIEVATALRNNKLTIPVLVEGAYPPREQDLPEDMKELAYRNTISVRNDPDFARDAQRLVDYLHRVLNTGQPKISLEEEQPKRKHGVTLDDAPIPQKQSSSSPMKLVGIIMALLIVGGLSAAFFLMSAENNPDDTSSNNDVDSEVSTTDTEPESIFDARETTIIEYEDFEDERANNWFPEIPIVRDNDGNRVGLGSEVTDLQFNPSDLFTDYGFSIDFKPLEYSDVIFDVKFRSIEHIPPYECKGGGSAYIFMIFLSGINPFIGCLDIGLPGASASVAVEEWNHFEVEAIGDNFRWRLNDGDWIAFTNDEIAEGSIRLYLYETPMYLDNLVVWRFEE